MFAFDLHCIRYDADTSFELDPYTTYGGGDGICCVAHIFKICQSSFANEQKIEKLMVAVK
jgi:hypothetical protein